MFLDDCEGQNETKIEWREYGNELDREEHEE